MSKSVEKMVMVDMSKFSGKFFKMIDCNIQECSWIDKKIIFILVSDMVPHLVDYPDHTGRCQLTTAKH